MAHLPALEGLLEFMAAILAYPVAVQYQARRWAMPKPGNSQRILEQAGLHLVLHAPCLPPED